MFLGPTTETCRAPAVSPQPMQDTHTHGHHSAHRGQGQGQRFLLSQSHMQRGREERCRLTFPGEGYLSTAGAGWTTGYWGPRILWDPGSHFHSNPAYADAHESPIGGRRENWAQAWDTGSHWGHLDLRGKTEGKTPPASGFLRVEGHRLLAARSKALEIKKYSHSHPAS